MICNACDGTGFEVVELDGREVAQRCACQAPMLEPLRLAGVPEHERGLQVEGLPPHGRSAYDRASAAMQAGSSVLLLGPAGRAKTAVSVCLLRHASQRGQSIAWCHLASWLREIRDTFNRRDDDAERPTETSLLAANLGADVLAVDDVGAEPMTEWARGMFSSLVWGRDSSEKPTVYSSNLPIENARGDSLASVYGDRIASRLKRCVRIPMTEGPDLRARAQAGRLPFGEPPS